MPRAFFRMTSIVKNGISLNHLIDTKISKGSGKEDVVDNPNRDDQKNFRFSANTPIDESTEKHFESMKYEINRFNTFVGKWDVHYLKPIDMSQVGFFYLQKDDQVQCAFCRGIISGWVAGDKPLLEHSKHFPLCPFLMGRDVGNVPISRFEDTYISISNGHEQFPQSPQYLASPTNYKPKFPAMHDFDRRLRTFRGWPLTTIQPRKLAEAGLYYTEVADIVTCFFCGGSLGNWDVEDEPLAEHETFYPNCAFVKFVSEGGPVERNLFPNTANQSEVPQTSLNGTFGGESSIASRVEKNDILKSEIVEKASEIFSEPLVKEVVLKRYNDTKREFVSLQELCEALLQQNQEQSESSPIQQSDIQMKVKENISLDRPKKDILLCKICMDRELGVVFLPCGHLISCETCAKEISSCPLCRKHIASTIRTYMS